MAARNASANPPSDRFETFPFPPKWHNPLRPRSPRQGVPRPPRRPDDRQKRGPHQNLQPVPRPQRRLPTHCEFLLDYEIDEESWGTKKKPYRRPNETRDEVLARLLELNAKRAATEGQA